MRKLLILALAAVAVFAVGSIASAQDPQDAPGAELTVTIDPKDAGTKRKPKPTKLELKVVNSDSTQTASRLKIFLSKKVKLSTKGLGKCDPQRIDAEGKSACTKRSRIGVGIAHARAGVNTAAPADLTFNVTAFIIGKNKLGFYLEQQGGAIRVLTRSKLKRVYGDPLYGSVLDVDIPGLAEQFPAGVFNGLVDLETSIAKKRRQYALIKTTGCTSTRELPFRVDITFIPNPNPPKAEKVTAIDGAPCSP